MKRSHLQIAILILFSCFFLAGCASPKNIIAPLKYQDDIKMHVPKNAYIYWISGKHVSKEKTSYAVSGSSGQGGIGEAVGSLIFAAIDNQNQKNNPSQYTHEYGKADAAVFITSLRDALTEQNVFKNTELVTNLDQVRSQDVLIKIYFKTARITDINNVTLTVTLSIKTGNKPAYEKTYLVQNDPDKAFKVKTFLEKKTDASQKLLTAIICGIKQWNEGHK
ncbi:MAG: hypothetical protein KKE11_03305 [Gammaproteobacteria bacterium]|nr:hypothetical protein [Gammaproteobacteria bacterium]